MFYDRLPGSGYVCAHRGARALTPENTLTAIRRGFELGADFWETDVQKTADGQLAIVHDDTLERTTDVPDRPEFADRKPWWTQEFTLAELQSLDAGSWFAGTDPYGTVASGEARPQDLAEADACRIPTLREVLAFTRANDFPMNIEIKDQVRTPGDLSIVSDILDMMREMDVEDLILISSFNHDYLREARRLNPAIPLAALTEERHPENLVDYLNSLGVAGYHPDEVITDLSLVRDLAGRGFHVTPYTVNDMDRAMDLIGAGCCGITTDYTHLLRARLDG
ncbi:glycerophosphodiester phosphodiesterase [Pseudodesulfovibrio sp.]|uniref:glycerophosphodiester phosphodiesterase n=1 Tax=unclassified Pseudodesulfovibrio TaxID=2661612 RepID=UPI003B000D50